MREVQHARAVHREIIEKSQVVVSFGDRLPCLFLVGDPDRQALDEAVGRMMMMAAMQEARRVIVDVSSLSAPEGTLPDALSVLADHCGEPAPEVLLSGVPAALSTVADAARQPRSLSRYPSVSAALAAAGLTATP